MMRTPNADYLDFSMFGNADVLNLCLQRGSRTGKLLPPKTRRLDDHDGAVEAIITEKRSQIFEIVFDELSEVFETFQRTIQTIKPASVADIGCGYAFVDLMIYRQFECDLVLIDIEASGDIHFGYKDEGAGYSDLATAREFLTANGVPDDRIVTINPKQMDLADSGNVDLAISLISCGFHYPVATYDAYLRNQVNKAILFDVRRGRGGFEDLSTYGLCEVVAKGKRHDLVLCEKKSKKSLC